MVKAKRFVDAQNKKEQSKLESDAFSVALTEDSTVPFKDQ